MGELEASAFFDWVRGFGQGPKGLIALAMLLLAWVVRGCLPEMYKARLAHVLALKELTAKTKELDLEFLKKLEKMGGTVVEVKQLPPGTKKKRTRS